MITGADVVCCSCSSMLVNSCESFKGYCETNTIFLLPMKFATNATAIAIVCEIR